MRNKPVRITPKQAAKWLAHNRANRPLSQVTVDRYAAAMQAAEWKLNGDSIRFDENGDLIDGQHRLHACVKSGRTFMSYVVTDLPVDAFDTIDQGRPRTMADVLARRGEKHYSTLAAACRFIWELETGKVGCAEKMRPSHLDGVLNEHPTIRESVEVTVKMMSNSKVRFIPGSHVAALHYLFGTIKPHKNKEFWERVIEGTGLSKEMPEYTLRKRLIENMGSVAKLPTEAVFALTIKTWNASSNNQTLKLLRWQPGEEFPKISGLASYPRLAGGHAEKPAAKAKTA